LPKAIWAWGRREPSFSLALPQFSHLAYCEEEEERRRKKIWSVLGMVRKQRGRKKERETESQTE
jgi:hypothetical protein